MIAKLTGTIEDIFSQYIILNVGGVGYKVTVSTALIQDLKADKKIVLYIYTHVTKDTLSLFGFTNKKELSFYELLLTVSKIGPKTALSVMNLGGVNEIITAISKADSDFFLGVPRVGRKNAQRIIIELRSKVDETQDIDLTFSQNKEQKELYDALAGFGFNRVEIKETMSTLPKDGKLEKRISQALKILGKKNNK